MLYSSDKDGAASVQQIATTNSTANAFLGGNHTRSWMTGSASSDSSTLAVPAKKKKKVSARASTITAPPPTVLPSPSPSDEPSPASDGQENHATDGAQVARPTQQLEQLHITNETQAVEDPPTRPMAGTQQGCSAPPSAPPAKRRKMTAANFPTLQAQLPIINNYLNSLAPPQRPNQHVEQQRFRLLQEACHNNDYFYVALHQIFCLWSIDQVMTTTSLSMQSIPNGKNNLGIAVAILSQLLVDNSAIAATHVRFFSEFPNQLSELIYRSDHYRLAVSNVQTFLLRLSSDWTIYSGQCLQRGYPPLVDELVYRFGLLSPILQHIAFTATRRNLGMPDDAYSAQMEQLFLQDRDAHSQMAARYNTAYPPTEREIMDRNTWQADEYLNIRLLQQGQAPPVLGSNAPSPSGTPPAAQAGPARITRTEVTPKLSRLAVQGSGAPNAPVSAQSPTTATTSQWPSMAFSGPQSTNPHPNAQPTTQSLPGNAQNMQQGQNQTSGFVQINPRNALPPHNQQNIQFSQADNGAVLPQANVNPLRRQSSPYSNNGPPPNPLQQQPSLGGGSVPALANTPAGQVQVQLQQQAQSQNLIPPVGLPAVYTLPQPERRALHQAYLRSPTLRPVDVDKGVPKNGPNTNYYLAVQGFASNPVTLQDGLIVSEYSFTVPKPVFYDISEDKVVNAAAPPVREVRQGSLQYRIRCCQMKSGRDVFDPSEFVVADTRWPSTIFMEMNNAVLEVRRKYHHGKDLPVDITSHVFRQGPENQNTIKISVPKAQNNQDDMRFILGVEVVEVLRHQQILNMCLNDQRLSAKEMIEDIKSKLSGDGNNDDDEVALVSTNLTIDLADPFTARIFAIPARGAQCHHRECFDLETFLKTRNSTSGCQKGVCGPDVWKCPLCSRDARPRSLRIDDFLVSVREKLERDGLLDFKAILVSADGSWEVKPETTPSTKRKSRGESAGLNEEEDNPRMSVPRSRQPSRSVEVIEVDDD